MSKTGFKGAFGARHFDLAARHFAARGRLASSLQGCILSSLRAAYELPQAACERLASSLRAAYEQPSLRGCIPNTLRAPYEQHTSSLRAAYEQPTRLYSEHPASTLRACEAAGLSAAREPLRAPFCCLRSNARPVCSHFGAPQIPRAPASRPENRYSLRVPNSSLCLELRPVAVIEWSAGTPSPERAKMPMTDNDRRSSLCHRARCSENRVNCSEFRTEGADGRTRALCRVPQCPENSRT